MEISFDASIESGNGLLAGSGRDWVAFAADPRTSPRAMWYFFRLADVDAEAVTCTLLNTAQCLSGPEGYRCARPVYSYNGETWFRAPIAHLNETDGEFRFRIPTPEREVLVAHCYPYTLSDVYTLCRRVDASPHARGGLLCLSKGGRKLPLLSIGRGSKRFIWLCCRSHSGETPGALVLEGLIDRLLGDSEAASYIRDTTTVYAIPAIDPDGVYTGAYGKDQAPTDFNRDYLGCSVHPEVAAVREYFASLAEASRPAMYLDFHAPSVPEHNFVLMPRRHILGREALGPETDFCTELEKRAPRLCPLLADACVESAYMGDEEVSSKDYFAREYGCLALTVESSYNRTAAGNYTTPGGLKQLGAAVADTCAHYLRDRDSKNGV